jgi:hypothetical protein
MLTESLNSNYAGRLPWCELARRVEGIKGEVELRVILCREQQPVPALLDSEHRQRPGHPHW